VDCKVYYGLPKVAQRIHLSEIHGQMKIQDHDSNQNMLIWVHRRLLLIKDSVSRRAILAKLSMICNIICKRGGHNPSFRIQRSLEIRGKGNKILSEHRHVLIT